ncbi:MAG: dihydrofolate reductase family protein [Streptosporangiaceae bacterium]
MRQIFPPSPRQDGLLPGPARDLAAAGRLTPARAAEPGVAGLIDAIAGLYRYPASDRPWVRANMVQSADGAVAVDGRSGGLSGPADRLVFSVLRSLADVILVGASTARSERYGRIRRHEVWPGLRIGRDPAPPVAVLSRRIDLKPDGRLLAGWPADTGDRGPASTILLTTGDAPADRLAAAQAVAEVVVAGRHEITAAAAVSALAALGHRRILLEGGPGLLGQFIAENLIDELCLTISPLLEGGRAGRITTAPGSGRGQPGQPGQPGVATGLALASLLEDDGFLLARYLRRTAG